jgi:FtsZ-interacting cell division protein ZipA
MSDLQISLLAIGAAVVAGVYSFNLLQERRYRRRAEEAFKSAHADVLLDDPPGLQDVPERIEPRFVQELPPLADPVEDRAEMETVPVPEPEPEIPQPRAEIPKAAAEDVAAGSPSTDPMVEYVATLHASDPIPAQKMAGAVQRSHEIGKPVRWFGLNGHTNAWEAATPATGSTYIELAVGLQLANRAGAVSDEQLSAFCAMVEAFADEQHAVAECPDRQPALQAAAELDGFCVDVDVLIGINVVAQGGAVFPATKIRALAEAAGMKLTVDGVFHYCNDRGDSLFSLCNHESAAFLQEQIKQLSTHGVTLVFDVPRVADGGRVFDQMAALGRKMASALGGALVDDNIRPLSDAGIARIRQQLTGIYAKMEARGIHAGSERALRLFS